MEISTGATVDINLGRGVVRFYGTTSFSSGKWVGIQLSEPVGKNDGSVNGVSYFTCQKNYGVFVKPSQVKLVQDPLPAASVSPLHFSQIMSRMVLTFIRSQAHSQVHKL
jgi:dynactin 1